MGDAAKWVHKLRTRSRRNGIPFDLKEADYTPPPVLCPCCGNTGKMERDRLVPELGYVRGNVGWLCRRCNGLKSDGTVRELRRIADWMEQSLHDAAAGYWARGDTGHCLGTLNGFGGLRPGPTILTVGLKGRADEETAK